MRVSEFCVAANQFPAISYQQLLKDLAYCPYMQKKLRNLPNLSLVKLNWPGSFKEEVSAFATVPLRCYVRNDHDDRAVCVWNQVTPFATIPLRCNVRNDLDDRDVRVRKHETALATVPLRCNVRDDHDDRAVASAMSVTCVIRLNYDGGHVTTMMS
jgi:hypothetical protein